MKYICLISLRIVSIFLRRLLGLNASSLSDFLLRCAEGGQMTPYTLSCYSGGGGVKGKGEGGVEGEGEEGEGVERSDDVRNKDERRTYCAQCQDFNRKII